MASKLPIFETLAGGYIAYRLRRTFLDVRVHELDRLRGYLNDGPVVLAVNHVCWWDPLVLFHLKRTLKFEGYALMARTNLEQLPFFSRLGAIPLATDNPRQAYQDLLSASRLLERPGRVVAIFPSGRQRASHRALEFRRGVLTLSRLARVPIVPLALRYDFTEGPRAVVHLGVASALPDTNNSQVARLSELEAKISATLVEIDELLESASCAPSILHSQSRHLSQERVPVGAQLLSLISRNR